MKKILFFLSFALVVISLQAQVRYKIIENSYQKISISFTFGELKSIDVNTDEGLFSRILIEKCVSSNNAGEPELPVSVNMLEIPFFREYNLNMKGIDSVVCDATSFGIKYPLYPAQPSVSKSHEGQVSFVQNKNIYQTDGFYALPLAQFEEVGVMRNVNLGKICVSPVQYNPVTHEIKIFKEMEMEIIFKQTELVKTKIVKELHKSPLFYPSNVINHVKDRKTEFENTPIKYLIVAHSMFRGALDEFVAWKKRKGFLVEIGYTDDSNVGTTTTSISAFIKSHYHNATTENPAPTFVLLVGDVQQIPTYTGTIGGHPTDLYYFTWAGGYLPCCYYGRFSAQSLQQLVPQIEKTLQYEQFTMPDPDYLNDVVLIAGNDPTFAPTYGNGVVNYVTHYYANEENGYANVFAHFYPCSTEAAQIRKEIGNGAGVAHYTGHGSAAGWGDPAFISSHIAAMSNLNKYGLMIGNCCLSNKFNEDGCFGEALLRAEGKGAMGYIGASNITYWQEDYCWAVGAKVSCLENPIYDPTKLGAYDRLFHKYGEPYNKWMTTFGAILKAGNEALQQILTMYGKYYWEIYHLMGDPSVMTYLTKPTAMKVEVPKEMNAGDNLMSAKVAPYAYCALSHSDEKLICAGFADADGNMVFNFDPIVPGKYEFAAWSQNHIQYFTTIHVITNECYITGTAAPATATIPQNDSYIFFELLLNNLGKKEATNIQLHITSDAEEVVIMNNTLSIHALAAGEEKIFTNLFKTRIKNFVQDETPVKFNIHVIANHNRFQKDIEVIVQAPKLSVSNIEVSNVSGSGVIAPGDEVNIKFELANIGHNTVYDIFSSVTSYFSGLELFDNEQVVDNIEAGDSKTMTFRGKIKSFVDENIMIPIYFSAFRGTYTAEAIGFISLGEVIEDFETGDFSKVGWQQGEHPWEITTTNVYQGVYSARSKTNVAGNCTSQLSITAFTPIKSLVTYARMVSSEAGFDFFKFYMDNQVKEHQSGTKNSWEVVSFEVEPGTHTYTFEYEKDAMVNEGLDGAQIDNISIPGMGRVIPENLPKIKIINHTIHGTFTKNNAIVGSAQISFDLKNIGLIDASFIIAEMTSNTLGVKIIAENTNANQSLPFSLLPEQEKTITFDIKTFIDKTDVELVFKVSCKNITIYYPVIVSLSKSDFPVKNAQYLIYPNPAQNLVMVEGNSIISFYEIMDINGRVVASKHNVNNYFTNINTTFWAAGVYFIRIEDITQKKEVQKIVKQ